MPLILLASVATVFIHAYDACWILQAFHNLQTVLRIAYSVVSRYNFPDTFHNRHLFSYLLFSWTVNFQAKISRIPGWLQYCCCPKCQGNGLAVGEKLAENKWLHPGYKIILKHFGSGAPLPSYIGWGTWSVTRCCSGVRNKPLIFL